MKYHDYHINEYTASDHGETITFDLVYGHPDGKTDRSIIRFTGVSLYNFIHTNNAIITNIYEFPMSEVAKDLGQSIFEWDLIYSVRSCDGNIDQYLKRLQSSGNTAWRIESAIDLYGFVIAKAVGNA